MYHMPRLVIAEVFFIFQFLTNLCFNYGINITRPYDIANALSSINQALVETFNPVESEECKGNNAW